MTKTNEVENEMNDDGENETKITLASSNLFSQDEIPNHNNSLTPLSDVKPSIF